MPFRINENVLNSVRNYHTDLNNILYSIMNKILPEKNLYISPNFALYALISENVRMNFNYLLFLNIEYDIFDFIGMHRNIRCSIETYYDLFNLTCDKDYLSLMKYYSFKENINLENLQIKYSKYLRYKFLTIQNKAEIAKENGLEDSIDSMLTEFRKTSNTYIHTDLFRKPKSIIEKDFELQQLIKFDCFLLTEAYYILLKCCKFFSKDEIQIDPYENLEHLQNILEFYDKFIIIY